MANEVKFTLAMDGGQVVSATIDGITHRFNAMGDGAKGAGDKAASGVDAIRQKLEQMQSTAVAVAQTLAGVFVVDKIIGMAKEMAMLNARYETLGVAMRVVGQNAGYTGAQMDMAASGMQAMGISMVESRQQAMRLVQAHIDLANAQKLARIAQDAAVIGNMNSSDAFAAMIHGISTGQTDVLRTIGLNVSMEQSYKAMADTLHKHVDALTQNERTQGVLNSVMKAGADIAGTYEAAMDTAGKQLNSMKRYTEDLKTVQGEVFNEVLTVAVMAYTSHLKESNAEARALAANGELKAWGMELAQVFVGVANAVDNMLTGVKMVGNWAAQRSVAGDITEEYQRKLDKLGNAPDVWKQRGELVAKRDAEIKASLALLDEANVELGARADRFQKAFDARQQAMADTAAKGAAAVADKLKQTQDAIINYTQMLETGQITQAQYLKGVALIQQAMNGDNHKFGDTTPAPKAQALTEYERLIKSIKEKIATNKLDLDTQAALTAGEKDRAKIQADLADKTLKLTGEQKKKVMALLDEQVSGEKALEADKAATKQLIADAAARQAARTKEYDGINAYIEAQTEGYNKAVQASKAALKAAQEQFDQYGKSKSQIAEVTLLTLQSAQAKVREGSEGYESLQKQIDSQRQLIQVLRNTEGLEAQKDMWVSIEGAAHTTFTNILQGGNDLAIRLRESLKAGFFDWLYQMTLKRWLFSASTSLSGSAVANAAMPGMASNAASLYSVGSSVATVGGQYLSGTMSGANAAGTIAANATGTGIDGLLATNGAFGTAAGSGAAAATAGAEAGAAAATAGAEAGASGVLAAIPGWGWAALGTVALLGIFGGDKGWMRSTGESTMQFDQAGNTTSATPHRYTDVDNSGADQAVKAMNRSYMDTAKSLGIGTVATEFGFGGSTNSDGLNRYRTGLNIGGKNVYDSGEQHADPGAVQLAASQAVLTALQSSELPKWMQGVFDGIDASKLDQNGVNAAIKSAQDLKSAYEVLGAVPGLNLTGLSYQTLNGVKDAFGGVDKMNQAVSAYVASMYSDSEKAAHANDALTSSWSKLEPELAKLGHSIPTTEAEFKALVSSIDVTTVSGQNLLASVLALAPAFDASAQAARAAASNMLSAIQNWGTSSDVRAFQAQMLQKNLADSGLSLSMDQIMGATQKSALEYYNSLDPNSAAAQALLKYQQDIFTFVGGKSASSNEGASKSAASGGGSSGSSAAGGGSGSSGSTATDSALSSWQRATDSIVQTMKDLRQTLIESSPSSFAQLQAQFATDVASSEAGSLTAYQGLPDLAKKLVDAQKAQSGSALEQSMFAANVLATLGRVSASVSAASSKPAVSAAAISQSAAGGSTNVMYEDKTLAWLASQNFSGQAANGYDGYEYANGAWQPIGMPQNGSMMPDGQHTVDRNPETGAMQLKNLDGSWVPYVPKFAGGGSHAGGWAMVGEEGPELAYLPPARIYTAPQTRSMLSNAGGSGGDGEILTELRSHADRLDAIEANTEATAIYGAAVARMLSRVIPDDEDAIAVKLVMTKGEFVPVRAV